jgi:predicted membrane chloride channel (bestrophin family)
MRAFVAAAACVHAAALVAPPHRITCRRLAAGERMGGEARRVPKGLVPEGYPESAVPAEGTEFPTDAPARTGAKNYLDRLAAYADEDGYTLAAPKRYSISDWWLNLQSLPSSGVLQRVQGHLVANTLFATLVAGLAAVIRSGSLDLDLPFDTSVLEAKDLNLGAPFELSGGILGILLAFRTSQSYDRFWEGRQVWAKVVNRVRATARTCRAYVTTAQPEDEAAQMATLLRWLEAFPVALKQHLRGERRLDDFRCLQDHERRELESADNLPLACTYALSARVDMVRRADESSQQASALLWWQLESLLVELQDAIGDSEAIAGTPVPLSYSRHTSRLLSIWTLGSPIVLVDHLPLLLVPPATALVSWMLLATEEIGHIIEEPFGIHDDRPKILPLQRYCDIISRDLAEENRLIENAVSMKRGSPVLEKEEVAYSKSGGVV